MNQHTGIKKRTNTPDASSHTWPEDKLPVLMVLLTENGAGREGRALQCVQKLLCLCIIYRSMYVDARKYAICLRASRPPQPNCFLSLEVSH